MKPKTFKLNPALHCSLLVLLFLTSPNMVTASAYLQPAQMDDPLQMVSGPFEQTLIRRPMVFVK